MGDITANNTSKTLLSFAVSNSGTYFISVYCESNYCDSYILFDILINGTWAKALSASWAPSHIPYRGSVSFIRNLSQGDVVKVTVVSGSSGNTNVGGRIELTPLR